MEVAIWPDGTYFVFGDDGDDIDAFCLVTGHSDDYVVIEVDDYDELFAILGE